MTTGWEHQGENESSAEQAYPGDRNVSGRAENAAARYLLTGYCQSCVLLAVCRRIEFYPRGKPCGTDQSSGRFSLGRMV